MTFIRSELEGREGTGLGGTSMLLLWIWQTAVTNEHCQSIKLGVMNLLLGSMMSVMGVSQTHRHTCLCVHIRRHTSAYAHRHTGLHVHTNTLLLM